MSVGAQTDVTLNKRCLAAGFQMNTPSFDLCIRKLSEAMGKREAAPALDEQDKRANGGAEAARKLKEKNEAAARAEQERRRSDDGEVARKQKERGEVARAEQERKEKEAADMARKLTEEKEVQAKAAQERQHKEEAEMARRLKEEKETAARAEFERRRNEEALAAFKQRELEVAETARKLKEAQDAAAARAEQERKALKAAKDIAEEQARFQQIAAKLETERVALSKTQKTARERRAAQQLALVERQKNGQMPNPGTTSKDCAGCPEMVVMPSGAFSMGSDFAPNVWSKEFSNEQPIHRVAVDSFLMGKVEVTQEQWDAVMGTGFRVTKFLGNCPDAACPVGWVSWNEAKEFVKKLTDKTGRQYRLPSEAEWEYAARAGSATNWVHDDTPLKLGEYAWYRENSGDRLQLISKKSPNSFGVFDMQGNAWEWVEDCWHKNYNDAPVDGSPWVTGCESSARTLRGGSVMSEKNAVRPSYRTSGNPSVFFFDYGVRVAGNIFSDEELRVRAKQEKILNETVLREEASASIAEREVARLDSVVNDLAMQLNESRARLGRLKQFQSTSFSSEVAERISRMANTPDLGSAAAITRETHQRLARMVEAPDSSNSRSVSTLLSSAYAARVIAALRPNITFNPDSIAGNPAVDIKVFLASDGTIRNTTIVRSSGSPSWDSAALKALDKTERLPKDENGQIPADLTIIMRPREF